MDTRLLVHTLLAILLLVIPAGALYVLERQKLTKFGISIAHMIVQLLGLCLMVWVLIKVDSVWLSLAWLVVLSVGMGWLVLRRCGLKGFTLLSYVALSLFLGVFLVGMWLLGIVLPVNAFSAQWFVPVMALLMGHSVSMLIRGLSTYLSALKADHEQYDFLRGNGQSHWTALLPFMRRALLAVVQPTMANLSVLALFSMPLLLVGLLLGGFTPINAFALMLDMTIGCVTASVVVLGLAVSLCSTSKFKVLDI
ncbi:MAG: ABC transporter permease [Prevotella sp.]|nr:ABC transporter permease [Prevotella sp.]